VDPLGGRRGGVLFEGFLAGEWGLSRGLRGPGAAGVARWVAECAGGEVEAGSVTAEKPCGFAGGTRWFPASGTLAGARPERAGLKRVEKKKRVTKEACRGGTRARRGTGILAPALRRSFQARGGSTGTPAWSDSLFRKVSSSSPFHLLFAGVGGRMCVKGVSLKAAAGG